MMDSFRVHNTYTHKDNTSSRIAPARRGGARFSQIRSQDLSYLYDLSFRRSAESGLIIFC